MNMIGPSFHWRLQNTAAASLKGSIRVAVLECEGLKMIGVNWTRRP